MDQSREPQYQASATGHFHKAINTYNGVYRAKKAETQSSQSLNLCTASGRANIRDRSNSLQVSV
jgi:hypothetical protein